METITLSAQVRTSKGKNENRRTRQTGKVPAVLYGQARPAVMLQINKHELDLLLQHTKGESVLIDLSVESMAADSPLKIYLKDLQRDPVSGKIVHADLLSVSLTETVDLEIPLHFIGNAPGAKDGGIVEFQMRSIEIRSLPQNAPRFMEVSIATLMIGDSLHVRELTGIKEGVEILSDPDSAIVSCQAPAAEAPEAVVAPVEGEVPAEPEIIGKGKKDEDEEGEGGKSDKPEKSEKKK